MDHQSEVSDHFIDAEFPSLISFQVEGEMSSHIATEIFPANHNPTVQPAICVQPNRSEGLFQADKKLDVKKKIKKR